ncbi:hypothetical protein [Sphingomonas sp. Leaf25]|uniref:hypothetical protein n=1 Tax=Sphingomonas sp. Leaf25 TaxID=1735692 RepID=UPI0012E25F20|nr:hypothetical protein [Sphingomonas sp. Leaf25]
MSEAADALAASALVLAILAALFSVWMPDVAAVMAEKGSTDKDNNGPLRTKLKLIARTRLYPLFAAALTTAIILLPRCWGIIRSPWTCTPWDRCHYDDVQALMLLTVLLLILLCVALIVQIMSVQKKLAGL